MCGSYRLSRRKQLVEEYFDTASGDEDWSPRYNVAPTQPVAVIRQNPKEPVRELLENEHSVQAHSTLGKNSLYRIEYDQREVGNSRHEACVPRFHEISEVLDSRRRVL
jgi:putative SOS response-associated peptidase YedK